MKTSLLLISFVFLASSIFSQSEIKRTDADIFGHWVTKVNEPIDGKCTIEVDWNSDHTADITFNYPEGNPSKTKSTWQYDHPNYTEVYADGSPGKATIKWINDNKFELIILENQATETYAGIVRVYKRKKKK